MYLVDTNIFLEILLGRAKKNICKTFLDKNRKDIHISDFTLHSIGVILFHENKEHLLPKFINDVVAKVSIVTLSPNQFKRVMEGKTSHQLDFDDAYQYCLAKLYSLELVTSDNHFNGITEIKVRLI